MVSQQDLIAPFKRQPEKDSVKAICSVARKDNLILCAAELFTQLFSLSVKSKIPAQFISKTHGMPGNHPVVPVKIFEHPQGHGPCCSNIHVDLLRIKGKLFLDSLPKTFFRKAMIDSRYFFYCRLTRRIQAYGTSGYCDACEF